MSKHHNGSQLDLNLVVKPGGGGSHAESSTCHVMPFVDSATLQIRRDAVRRVASNGIFKVLPFTNR